MDWLVGGAAKAGISPCMGVNPGAHNRPIPMAMMRDLLHIVFELLTAG